MAFVIGFPGVIPVMPNSHTLTRSASEDSRHILASRPQSASDHSPPWADLDIGKTHPLLTKKTDPHIDTGSAFRSPRSAAQHRSPGA